jgi:demethylmenaquinone methyltransferase / 2-methoxy-6-polyprenyl-1,4-benzoquinol methylase
LSDNKKIEGMFSKISNRYDIANHLLSFGMDILWRRKTVRLFQSDSFEKVLDVCCGTGDIAMEFKRQFNDAEVVGADISGGMIEIAKAKAKQKNVDIKWTVEDCCEMYFEDESFDIVSCGFGIRNISEFRKALCKMKRVLKVGGRVCILEFSMPKFLILRALYGVYLGCILPVFGGIITGHFKEYKYLSSSIKGWASEVDMTDELKAEGFCDIEELSMSFGIVRVYIGKKNSVCKT